MSDTITGTNCGNCKFANKNKSTPMEPSLADHNGGVNRRTSLENDRAKRADLVSLPGEEVPEQKFPCNHKLVKMEVNQRMCCAFWDADGVYRSFGKQAVGK